MDNVLYSSLTMNVQPLHLDEEFASKTEFGQRIVNSLFTLGLMIGITVNDTTLGTTVANLGMTDVRFPKPVFHGDTLGCRPRCASVRESKSRPDAGIVEFAPHRHQPARRGRRPVHAPGADAQETQELRDKMRSFLFVPADSERKLAKGPSSGPDALILDLEDSVAADRKKIARDMACAYLKGADRSGPKLYVRVNALDTGLTLGDLAVVMQGRPDGIVFPKCVGQANLDLLAT